MTQLGPTAHTFGSVEPTYFTVVGAGACQVARMTTKRTKRLMSLLPRLGKAQSVATSQDVGAVAELLDDIIELVRITTTRATAEKLIPLIGGGDDDFPDHLDDGEDGLDFFNDTIPLMSFLVEAVTRRPLPEPSPSPAPSLDGDSEAGATPGGSTPTDSDLESSILDITT